MADSVTNRFRAGEPNATAEVYDRYAKPMYAAALRLLNDHHLAAEAVQLTFVRAWRAAATFDEGRHLQPWLYAILRRAAIDVHRRERRHAHALPLEAAPEARLAQDTTSIEQTWTAWRVRAALAAMPPQDRTVLVLAHFQALNQKEIADVLGVPVGTVKSRTSRAQRRLARVLANDFAADGSRAA